MSGPLDTPDEPAIVVPDVVGEIVGWRYWKVSQTWSKAQPPVLRSEHGRTDNATTWPTDDWFHATCSGKQTCSKGVAIPGEGCSCGIYAANDRREFVAQWGYHKGYQTGSRDHLLCMGEVGLAGKVIPGTNAHRAEKARPIKLYFHVTDWKIASAVQDAYRVEIELVNIISETDRVIG